jgi:hypothetical protein
MWSLYYLRLAEPIEVSFYLDFNLLSRIIIIAVKTTICMSRNRKRIDTNERKRELERGVRPVPHLKRVNTHSAFM